jgi:hypothetical protein
MKNADTHILHYCKTAESKCGIGNFSRLLNQRMNSFFNLIDFSFNEDNLYSKVFRNTVVIFHHEFSFENEKYISAIKDIKSRNVIISFIHSDCEYDQNRQSRFIREIPDGYISMNHMMINTRKPVMIEKCPGFYQGLKNRSQLKIKYNLPLTVPVVGTFSMMTHNRQIEKIVRTINSFNNEVYFLIYSPMHETQRSIHGSSLSKFLHKMKNVKLIDTFGSCIERNDLMQACDLLWCYSDISNMRYASASCSDMYCSGTKLIINRKPQHWHVQDNPNVVCCESDRFEDFVNEIKNEILLNEYTRSEPLNELKFINSFSNIPEFISYVKLRKKEGL